MRNIKILLGKKIKETRKKKLLTQEKLAELAKIETPSLSNIENGKNYPGHETLGKISSALGVNPYELFIFDYFKSKGELIEEMIEEMKKDETLVQRMYQYFIMIK